MEIRLDSVRKVYNQGRPNEFWAIRGISLHIELGYTRLSMGLFLFFYLIAAWPVLSSNLVMQGVWW
jgi:hypothetical protein